MKKILIILEALISLIIILNIPTTSKKKEYNGTNIKFKVLEENESESTIMYLEKFQFDKNGISQITYDAKTIH